MWKTMWRTFLEGRMWWGIAGELGCGKVEERVEVEIMG